MRVPDATGSWLPSPESQERRPRSGYWQQLWTPLLDREGILRRVVKTVRVVKVGEGGGYKCGGGAECGDGGASERGGCK